MLKDTTAILTFPHDAHAQIPHTLFEGGRRATVATFVVYRRSLLLVNHVRAPEGQFTLPQKGAEWQETTVQTTIRLLRDEISLFIDRDYRLQGNKVRFLGNCVNDIPGDRGTDYTQKIIRFVAVRSLTNHVGLDPAELRAHLWVEGWQAFIEATRSHATRRPEKWQALLSELKLLCVPKTDARGAVYEDAFLDWGPYPNT
jgi:hypothetical protein